MKIEARANVAALPLRAPVWSTLVATFCGIGRLRPGPGTWASATSVVLWWCLTRFIPAASPGWLTAILALLAVGIGIPAASRVALASSNPDPQFVVIDEVAGQLIALIGSPPTWKCMLAAFILFRIFDIWKPPPVRQLERLSGGWGIVLDDVGAGFYALGAMQLLLHLGILPR